MPKAKMVITLMWLKQTHVKQQAAEPAMPPKYQRPILSEDIFVLIVVK
jgi:hypothetical protein